MQNRFCSSIINKENVATAGTMNDGMCEQLLIFDIQFIKYSKLIDSCSQSGNGEKAWHSRELVGAAKES